MFSEQQTDFALVPIAVHGYSGNNDDLLKIIDRILFKNCYEGTFKLATGEATSPWLAINLGHRYIVTWIRLYNGN